jgi:competence protein ComEA
MPHISIRSNSSLFSKVAALVLVLFYAVAVPAAFAVEPEAKAAQKSAVIAKVNINTASAEDLAEMLTGIGASKAAAIVAHREQHGAFKSVEELMSVKGIGEATLEKNRDRISL